MSRLELNCLAILACSQGWNKLRKTGRAKRYCSCLCYSSLPPPLLIGGTCPFCPPVEDMHAVTIMSLKAIGLQLSVGTVLTSRQIR